MSQYFKIGKWAASHGLKGDLILHHHLGKKTSLKGLEVLFIEEQTDRFLPYFIEKTTIKSEEEIYIKLDGVNTPEAARKLTPKSVWLQEADFKKFSAKSAPISFLGFRLIEGENDLGEILEVIEQPHQILCTIMYKGKEAYVPLHEESLQEVDAKKKIIYVDLPDGLLDVYA